MQRVFINPEYQQRLESLGLANYDALLGLREAGELIATDVGRTTHRVQFEGTNYYLKIADKPNVSSAVEALLSLRMPHHYCWREMQQVFELQACGIPVMEVIAAGESTTWGAPDFSYILVKEVPGEVLEDVFSSASAEQKQSLIRQLGHLVGKLHKAGFFTPVRMKDVIVNLQGQFVLIDRETRKPGARTFSRKKALYGLKRTMYRQARDGAAWSGEELRMHADAYLSEAGDLIDLDPPQLARLLEVELSMGKNTS